MGIMRYPGGKGKVSKVICTRLADFMSTHPDHEYREPFFGGGAVGFELLKRGGLSRIWFNDRDPNICAVWNAIATDRIGLKNRILEFEPTVKSSVEFKQFLLEISEPQDIDNYPLTEVAFKKIACHQMSFSGLGTMSGVQGGHDQKSKYKVDCRWSPKNLVKNIDKSWGLVEDLTFHRTDLCTCLDFEEIIDTLEHPSFMYLDPPYYEQGRALYQFSFTKEDHDRLAAALRRTEHPWLLSYDNHPYIMSLYDGWADIDYLELFCTINGPNKKHEVLISSKNFQ